MATTRTLGGRQHKWAATRLRRHSSCCGARSCSCWTHHDGRPELWVRAGGLQGNGAGLAIVWALGKQAHSNPTGAAAAAAAARTVPMPAATPGASCCCFFASSCEAAEAFDAMLGRPRCVRRLGRLAPLGRLTICSSETESAEEIVSRAASLSRTAEDRLASSRSQNRPDMCSSSFCEQLTNGWKAAGACEGPLMAPPPPAWAGMNRHGRRSDICLICRTSCGELHQASSAS